MSNLLLQLFLICNQKTDKHMFKTLLVGGCVRDMLLNREVKDFDIVTNRDLDNLAFDLFDNGWKVSQVTMSTGMKILHVTKNSESYEIANFRGSQKTVESDAGLRDFTINAIYFDPITNMYVDPTGNGLDDIEHRVLRFNNKPVQRIKEDPVRLYRFYRFLHQLKQYGFKPNPSCLKSVREHFDEYSILVKPNRIREELEKMI